MNAARKGDTPSTRKDGVGASSSRRLPTPCAFAVIAEASAALLGTWSRLFVGVDLMHARFDGLLPWRWVLGDRPFVQEPRLLQFRGILEHPC